MEALLESLKPNGWTLKAFLGRVCVTSDPPPRGLWVTTNSLPISVAGHCAHCSTMVLVQGLYPMNPHGPSQLQKRNRFAVCWSPGKPFKRPNGVALLRAMLADITAIWIIVHKRHCKMRHESPWQRFGCCCCEPQPSLNRASPEHHTLSEQRTPLAKAKKNIEMFYYY